MDGKKQPRSQKRNAWVWNYFLNKHELVSTLQDMSAIRWPMSASCPIIFQMSISNVVNHPSKCQNKSSSPFCCLFFCSSSFLLSFSDHLFLPILLSPSAPSPLPFTAPFFPHSLPSSLICFPSFLFLSHLYLCNLPLSSDIIDHEADLTFSP